MTLEYLRSGPMNNDWRLAPRAIGTYTLWTGDRLLYTGVAGRGRPPTTDRIWGLQDRLNAHLSGSTNRDANQFLTRVFDVFILPRLTPALMEARLEHPMLYDQLTHAYVRNNVGYRCMAAPSYAEAQRRETEIRRTWLPLLNPERTP